HTPAWDSHEKKHGDQQYHWRSTSRRTRNGQQSRRQAVDETASIDPSADWHPGLQLTTAYLSDGIPCQNSPAHRLGYGQESTSLPSLVLLLRPYNPAWPEGIKSRQSTHQGL